MAKAKTEYSKARMEITWELPDEQDVLKLRIELGITRAFLAAKMEEVQRAEALRDFYLGMWRASTKGKRGPGERTRDKNAKLIDITLAMSYLDELKDPEISDAEIGRLLDELARKRTDLGREICLLLDGISGNYLRQRIGQAIDLIILHFTGPAPANEQRKGALDLISGRIQAGPFPNTTFLDGMLKAMDERHRREKQLLEKRHQAELRDFAEERDLEIRKHKAAED
jgi:hypothetical protein